MSNIPIGVRLFNPGDLRPLPNGELWQGQSGVTDGFCRFYSMEYGVRAAAKTLRSYFSVGWSTCTLIAEHWAPASDGNDPVTYAKALANAAGVQIEDRMDANEATIQTLVTAIFVMEGTHRWVSDAEIVAGVSLAFA